MEEWSNGWKEDEFYVIQKPLLNFYISLLDLLVCHWTISAWKNIAFEHRTLDIQFVCPHISPWWLWSGLCLGSGDLNTSCPAHDWLLPLSPHNTKIEVSTEFCDSFSNMQRLISFVDKCHINLGWTHHVKAPIYGSVLIDSWRHR